MIYYIITLFIIIYGLLGKVNQTSKRKKIFMIISFGLLTLISALRKYSVGIDMNILYAPQYLRIGLLSWAELWDINLETGYLIFCKLLTYISKDVQALIIASSFLVVPAYGYFIYKNSKNVLVSTLLFLMMNSYFMSMNIVRQEIAIAIILYGYEYLKNSKYLKFLILIIIASYIHQSAFLCILLIPIHKMKFKKKTLVIGIIVTILGMLFYEKIIFMFTEIISFFGLNHNKDYTIYLSNENYNVGVQSWITISKYMIAIFFGGLSYYYLVHLNKEKNRENDFIIFGTILYAIIILVSSKMIIISRLEHYFLPFALLAVPESLSKSNYSFNKSFIYIGMFFMLSVRYIYMIKYLCGALYGTSPYLFFWQ